MANNTLIVAAAMKYLGSYDGPKDFNSVVLAAANKYLGPGSTRRSLNGAVLAALTKYTTIDSGSLTGAIINAATQYGVTGRSLSTLIDKSMTKYLTAVPGPINTVLPSISGTTQVGSVLTATTGTWTGTGPITYTYQWKRNGSNLAGATNSTYTLVALDETTLITVTVTATNVDGATVATSTAVGPITVAASDVTPDAIPQVDVIDNAVPGVSGSLTRNFTITGINVPITLSVRRTGQVQTGTPTVNRIDIYTKPSGGSFALAAKLGPVPGAVQTFSVSNGTQVLMSWLFETASGAASTSFTFHLENASAGGTSLTTSYYSMNLLG